MPYAFFDLDETLVNLKSLVDFDRYYFRYYQPQPWPTYARRWAGLQLTRVLGGSRQSLSERFHRAYQGISVGQLERALDAWQAGLRERSDLWISASLQRLREHQRDGLEAVIVSATSLPVAQRVASLLGIENVLATRLEQQSGRYTGRLVGAPMVGEEKRRAVEEFLRQQSATPAVGYCYAYGDHRSDLPMLEAVGHPYVVPGDPQLLASARARGWPVLASEAAEQ